MKAARLWWLALVLTMTLHMLVAPRLAAAQDDQDQQEQQDPPTRVARLNYSSGSVSFQPGGEGDWVTAVVNRPLTTGDNLWADQNSRAELHVGSLAIRMNSETSLTFLDLDDRTTQLRLSVGSLILRVRHLDDGDLLEVDTPNVAFTVQRTGEYRIDVNQDGTQTITTVWQGRGEATGGGYSYTVVAGQQATFSGTDQLDHEIGQIAPPDDFDNFAFERDRRDDHDESSNYISPEMTGYEDLDDYGHWHYVADYGPVWTPSNIGPGWAPYRFGHWVWIAPWGWTWVDDEPWGFAPFHYGRWAFVDSGWCWVPGPVFVRPVYAPALVAFVGGGGFRFSVGVGEGVAWFPLGPREVYVPAYRVSRVYVNNVNITNTRVNVTQVTNVYNTYTTNTNINRIAVHEPARAHRGHRRVARDLRECSSCQSQSRTDQCPRTHRRPRQPHGPGPAPEDQRSRQRRSRARQATRRHPGPPCHRHSQPDSAPLSLWGAVASGPQRAHRACGSKRPSGRNPTTTARQSVAPQRTRACAGPRQRSASQRALPAAAVSEPAPSQRTGSGCSTVRAPALGATERPASARAQPEQGRFTSLEPSRAASAARSIPSPG